VSLFIRFPKYVLSFSNKRPGGKKLIFTIYNFFFRKISVTNDNFVFFKKIAEKQTALVLKNVRSAKQVK